jgi:DNA-directed RNA polymerase specialized sigma24 family protein
VGPVTAAIEDSALIRRVLAGQTDCFEVLINRHLPTVRARVRLMAPNTADVDDILQEILCRLSSHNPVFVPG